MVASRILSHLDSFVEKFKLQDGLAEAERVRDWEEGAERPALAIQEAESLESSAPYPLDSSPPYSFDSSAPYSSYASSVVEPVPRPSLLAGVWNIVIGRLRWRRVQGAQLTDSHPLLKPAEMSDSCDSVNPETPDFESEVHDQPWPLEEYLFRDHTEAPKTLGSHHPDPSEAGREWQGIYDDESLSRELISEDQISDISGADTCSEASFAAHLGAGANPEKNPPSDTHQSVCGRVRGGRGARKLQSGCIHELTADSATRSTPQLEEWLRQPIMAGYWKQDDSSALRKARSRPNTLDL